MDESRPLTPIEALILVRLLPAGESGVKTTDLRKDLEPLLGHRWSGNSLTEVVDRNILNLVSRQLALNRAAKSKKARPAIGLTAEGRQAALGFLMIDQLPSKPKTTWANLKKALLLAPALGLSGPGTSLSKDDHLRAALLARQYDLQLGETPSLKQAKSEWLRRTLGMGEREKITLETVQAALFRRESGEEHPLPPKRALDRLLARRLGARRDDTKEMRETILRGWISGGDGVPQASSSSVDSEWASAPQPSSPLDLGSFSQKVKAAAQACLTGRYGGNKVFIIHVWRSLQQAPEFRRMDLNTFKQHLTEANNARLLDLSRADLIQAMDRDDVQLSEVAYLSATFHFIRIDSSEIRYPP
jgi:hypothetical protein